MFTSYFAELNNNILLRVIGGYIPLTKRDIKKLYIIFSSYSVDQTLTPNILLSIAIMQFRKAFDLYHLLLYTNYR